MALNHTRMYMAHPLTDVVAAADPDEENLRAFCDRFGIKAAYTSAEEMLAREQIDIASPVLPVNVNPDIVIQAAQAGVKAIFCEKPIAAKLSDADRMVEECSSRGIPFAAGDAFRNMPQYWQAKAMIDSGELGEVQSINCYEPSAEISGGGCQTLGLVRMFADDADVEWVIGWVSEDPNSDVDQNMGGVIRFENGIECFVHRKRSAKRGIEVNCSSGIFWSDSFNHRIWKLGDDPESKISLISNLRAVEGVLEDVDLNHTDYDEEGWRTTRGDFRTEASVQCIVDCLEKGVEPRCSGDNIRRVLEIAIAFRESHRRGHAPVKFPLEDRSLCLYPKPSRWQSKKEAIGKEEYAKKFESISKTR
jgi:predicted dehydrogenase